MSFSLACLGPIFPCWPHLNERKQESWCGANPIEAKFVISGPFLVMQSSIDVLAWDSCSMERSHPWEQQPTCGWKDRRAASAFDRRRRLDEKRGGPGRCG